MFLLSSLIAQLFHGTSQHFTNNVWNISEYTLSLAFNSTADLNERWSGDDVTRRVRSHPMSLSTQSPSPQMPTRSMHSLILAMGCGPPPPPPPPPIPPPPEPPPTPLESLRRQSGGMSPPPQRCVHSATVEKFNYCRDEIRSLNSLI